MAQEHSPRVLALLSVDTPEHLATVPLPEATLSGGRARTIGRGGWAAYMLFFFVTNSGFKLVEYLLSPLRVAGSDPGSFGQLVLHCGAVLGGDAGVAGAAHGALPFVTHLATEEVAP